MTLFLRRCGPVDRNTRAASVFSSSSCGRPPDKVQKYGNGFVTKQKEKHLSPMPEFFCLVASFEEQKSKRKKKPSKLKQKKNVMPM